MNLLLGDRNLWPSIFEVMFADPAIRRLAAGQLGSGFLVAGYQACPVEPGKALIDQADALEPAHFSPRDQ